MRITTEDNLPASDLFLLCLNCEKRIPATVTKLHCEDCGGLFKLAYAEEGNHPLSTSYAIDRNIRLGEGQTPLIALACIGRSLGLSHLSAKLEFISPTGSFKDRGSGMLVSAAVAEGITEFVEDSSGNAGASLAAYAAAAGIKAHIFVPSSAASGKLDQIRIFGAELHMVDGPRQAATDAAMQFVAERHIPYLSHNLSPYFYEGMKSFSHELVHPLEQQSGEPTRFDHIVLPVGNGSLLIGAKAAFDEFRERIDIKMPEFHAVQVDSVQPIAAAINNRVWDSAQARPTAASGIAVASPPRLAQSVDAVRSSGGRAVVVTDEAAVKWQRQLARDEGIFCEITSAVAFAGLQQLVADGTITPGDHVLVPITGSGLKEPLRDS